jgi:nucleotide-binding universal stress UspA family protein
MNAPPRPRLLVTVDDSKESDATVAFAGMLARQLDAEVALFATGKRDRKRERAFATAERILGLPAARRAATIAKEGPLERALPEACREWEADVAVVGRLGSLDWLTHGLVLTHIVRKVPCSLLHVKGGPRKLERILACTSEPLGEDTVRTALRLGAASRAKVTLIHVLSQMRLETSRFEEERDMVEELIKLEVEVRAHLDRAREWAAEAHVDVEVKIRTGLVEEELLDEVKRGAYDLVIAGAHKPAAQSHLLRDIADWLVHHVQVATLVVKKRLP